MHNAGMIYGYARVSTAAQDLTGQRGQLKHAGCEKVYCEKITGTYADRPQLRKLLASLDDRAAPVTGWSKRTCRRHPERPPRNA